MSSLSRFGLIVAGCGLGGLVCGSTYGFQAPDAMAGWKIERFNWTGPAAAGGLKVSNPHGDVRLRPSGDDQVLVSAVIQRDQNDPMAQDIRIDRDEDDPERLVVEADWKLTAEGAAVENERMKKRRIDLTVLVPAGGAVWISTDAGLIEAKGLENPVDVRTVSGEVRLSSSRRVRALAERGEMNITFTGGGWLESSVLESTTGRITAWLSPEAEVTVRGETTGLITTDFSVEIENAMAPTFRKRAVAEIGGGGDELILTSAKGDLRILSLPR